MPRPNANELCRKYIFEDADNFRDKVSQADFDKIIRCRAMYLWMLEQPQATDAAFVSEVCNRFKVSRPTAYSDLAVLKVLLPDLSKTAREFHRWRFNQMILETYDYAKRKGDTRTMEKAISTYAKFNDVGNFDVEIDLSEQKVQPFVPTMDPRVLGIEPMPDLKERKAKLLDKYMREVEDIRDIDFEEVDLPEPPDITESPLTPGDASDLFNVP